MGGINKELKAAKKKVWPNFPIQVGMFSLLHFGHSKVEAATLNDFKLVDIEFKRHNPHKIVENHLAQFNMKDMCTKTPCTTKYLGELSLMRRYRTDSKPCPQINKLVLSTFKSTGGTTYQRYYKGSK
jgi:hypothetical protein